MERKDSQISSATVRHCILQDEHLVLCGTELGFSPLSQKGVQQHGLDSLLVVEI